MKKQIDSRKRFLIVLAVLTVAFLAARSGFDSYFRTTGEYSSLYLLPAAVMAACVCYALLDVTGNSFFLCFLACFFTFLLGRRVIYRVTGESSSDFSPWVESRTDFKLAVGLFGLLFGYMLLDFLTRKKGGKKPSKFVVRKKKAAEIRAISKLLFYCAFPCWLYTMLDVAFFVLRNGYAEYYVSYSSSVPTLIRLIGTTAPMFFFVFLGMMPRKREALLPIALYLVYAVASLATGRRLTLITSLVIIFAYCLLRNKAPNRKETWISKKILLGMCVLVPLLLMAMYLFEYIRGAAAVGNASDNHPLWGFFIRQGVSVNVIKYAQAFEEKANPQACYSLYSTLKWFDDSFLAKLLGVDLPYEFGKQTPLVAFRGTSLAHMVSYYANRRSYLAGMGYGSCYIAELYMDFGYWGVWLGNVLYGAVICLLLKRAPQRGYRWVYAIGLFVCNSLFVAPRASFDEFFAKLLYVDCWAPLALLLLLAYNKKLNALTMKLVSIVQRESYALTIKLIDKIQRKAR